MATRHAPMFLCAVLLITASFAADPPKPKQADFDTMLQTVRADVRADKVSIVKQLMKLRPAEADEFWPVYQNYDLEVRKLNDERIRIIKEYADKFGSLTDAQAKSLAERMFAWEGRRTELRKNYFTKFSEATSAMTAAKFFQIEHRLDLLVDFVVAAEVPGLFAKTPASTAATAKQ